MGKPIETVICPKAGKDDCPCKDKYCSHMVVHNRGGSCDPQPPNSHPNCPACVKY